jgi:hypothetical protein
MLYNSAWKPSIRENWSYQFSFPRRQSLHRYYKQKEEQGENRNAFRGSSLSSEIVSTAPYPSRTDRKEAHNDSVVPSKDRKFIKSSNQIPPGCDVAGYEYAQGQDRERVHEAALLLDHGISSWISAHWRHRDTGGDAAWDSRREMANSRFFVQRASRLDNEQLMASRE